MTVPSTPRALQPPVVSSPPVWPAPAPRPLARTLAQSDVPSALRVLSLVALIGLPLAWVWSRLAPPQVSVVQADRTLAAVPPESQHRFDDLALFVLLGVAAGVLSALVVWLMRQRRGPLLLLALAAGSLLAAWLAMRLGLSFTASRYAAVGGSDPDSVVSAAARLESAWVLIAQPLAAVLTYGVAAAANGLDDLGR